MWKFVFIALLHVIFISGCSGGDDGTDISTIDLTLSGTPVEYSGSSLPATITTQNIAIFADQVFGGSDASITSTNINLAKSATSKPVLADNRSPFQYLTKSLKNRKVIGSKSFAIDAAVAQEYQTLSGAMIEETDSALCFLSGSLSLAVLLDDVTLQSTIKITFVDCNNGEGTINGDMLVKVHSGSISSGAYEIDKATISFIELLIDEGGESYIFSGEMYVDYNILGEYSSEVTLLKATVLEKNSGKMFKAVDLKEVVSPLRVNVSFSGEKKISYSGRIYDSEYGYVDVVTVKPIESDSRGVPYDNGLIE